MSEEEIEKIFDSIPKVENPNIISSFNSINADDLKDSMKRLKKVPTFNDLLKENKQLKKDYNRVVHESTEFESKVYELQDKLQQRDSVIEEAIRFCNYLLENNVIEINNERYYKHSCDDIVTKEILQRLNKYKKRGE